MTVQLFFKMLLAWILSIFTSVGAVFGGAKPAEPCMIGHRGYSGIYMENTELAFEKAAEHGSGGAETDIRKTKDGVYVTSHNSDIVLKDGTELEIAEHTYEELTAQPLKNKKGLQKVYLCTFERYLEIMKENDMICFIELKGEFSDDEVKEIFDLAAKTYELDKCILQSFNFDNLLKARALFPELPIMLTADGETTEEEIQMCFDNNISIDIEYTAATEELVKEFREHNLYFAVWTCNDPLSVAYSKSLGVDFIESDLF